MLFSTFPVLSEECRIAIDAFFTSAEEATEIRQVRNGIETHIRELEEELFDDPDIMDELADEGLYIDSPDAILECPLCTASSVALKGSLEADSFFGDKSISLRLTKKKVGDTEFHHYYLIVKDYLSSGEELIIDPTIRQFFVFRQDREVIDEQVPKVFIGNKTQLRVLFEQFGPKDSLVEADVWVKTYLNTKENFVTTSD